MKAKELMKKVVGGTLVAAMAITMLAGCVSKTEAPKADTKRITSMPARQALRKQQTSWGLRFCMTVLHRIRQQTRNRLISWRAGLPRE